MTLQKGVANAVNTRVNRLVSHSLTSSRDAAGESAAPNVMEEQAEAWVNGSQIEWGVDG